MHDGQLKRQGKPDGLPWAHCYYDTAAGKPSIAATQRPSQDRPASIYGAKVNLLTDNRSSDVLDRAGIALSGEDVLRLLAQREGVRGVSRLVIHRDEDGRPCPARKVVHRGGVIKKSLIPLAGEVVHAIAAEGPREKHAAWLLRAASCVSGIVAQGVELEADEGSWIPDYVVITKPFSIVLLEVKGRKWFGDKERERLRRFFVHALDHDLRPVLWTDDWLKRNELVANLSFLHTYRTYEVRSDVANAISEVIAKHHEVRLSDFIALNRPQVLCSVYALLGQERLHVDLTRPKSEWVIRNEAFDTGAMTHGQDQLFRGADV